MYFYFLFSGVKELGRQTQSLRRALASLGCATSAEVAKISPALAEQITRQTNLQGLRFSEVVNLMTEMSMPASAVQPIQPASVPYLG